MSRVIAQRSERQATPIISATADNSSMGQVKREKIGNAVLANCLCRVLRPTTIENELTPRTVAGSD